MAHGGNQDEMPMQSKTGYRPGRFYIFMDQDLNGTLFPEEAHDLNRNATEVSNEDPETGIGKYTGIPG